MDVKFKCGKSACEHWRRDNRFAEGMGKCKLLEAGKPVEILSIGDPCNNLCECRQFEDKWE